MKTIRTDGNNTPLGSSDWFSVHAYGGGGEGDGHVVNKRRIMPSSMIISISPSPHCCPGPRVLEPLPSTQERPDTPRHEAKYPAQELVSTTSNDSHPTRVPPPSIPLTPVTPPTHSNLPSPYPTHPNPPSTFSILRLGKWKVQRDPGVTGSKHAGTIGSEES